LTLDVNAADGPPDHLGTKSYDDDEDDGEISRLLIKVMIIVLEIVVIPIRGAEDQLEIILRVGVMIVIRSGAGGVGVGAVESIGDGG